MCKVNLVFPEHSVLSTLVCSITVTYCVIIVSHCNIIEIRPKAVLGQCPLGWPNKSSLGSLSVGIKTLWPSHNRLLLCSHGLYREGVAPVEYLSIWHMPLQGNPWACLSQPYLGPNRLFPCISQQQRHTSCRVIFFQCCHASRGLLDAICLPFVWTAMLSPRSQWLHVCGSVDSKQLCRDACVLQIQSLCVK